MNSNAPSSENDARDPQPPLCVVADDVRVIRDQFSRWLGELGFNVIHAACGATALKATRQELPQLVVTDIDMPHFSGLHLLETLRRDPEKKVASVPVIIASSLEDHGVSRMVETLGGSAYLRKPVEKKRFFECVRAIVAGETHDWEDSGLPHQVSSRFRRIISEIES